MNLLLPLSMDDAVSGVRKLQIIFLKDYDNFSYDYNNISVSDHMSIVINIRCMIIFLDWLIANEIIEGQTTLTYDFIDYSINKSVPLKINVNDVAEKLFNQTISSKGHT
jgi:hypothetical protein